MLEGPGNYRKRNIALNSYFENQAANHSRFVETTSRLQYVVPFCVFLWFSCLEL